MKNSSKNHQPIWVGIMLATMLSTADALALGNCSSKPQLTVQQPSPALTNTASYRRFLSAQNAPNRATTEPQKAAQVIRHYYDAINRKDYRNAYADWAGNGAASHQTFEQFQQGFANTASEPIYCVTRQLG